MAPVHPLLVRTIGAGLSLVGLLVATGAAVSAQEHSVSDLGALVGCWAGTMGSLDMYEQWSDADGGAMLGTTRFIRDGRLVDFEFGMLVDEEGTATLWPYPRGERSEHGFPLVSAEGEWVFENLEHDFPVRIVYRFEGPDHLTPRIEGRDGSGPSWSLNRVTCAGTR